MENQDNELWCAEYSVSQKYFHIDTVVDTILCNRGNAIAQSRADYQIIGIFNSYDKAKQFINDFSRQYKIPHKVLI